MKNENEKKFVALLNGEDAIPETLANTYEEADQAAWQYALGAAEDDLMDEKIQFNDDDVEECASDNYPYEIEEVSPEEYQDLL